MSKTLDLNGSKHLHKLRKRACNTYESVLDYLFGEDEWEYLELKAFDLSNAVSMLVGTEFYHGPQRGTRRIV